MLHLSGRFFLFIYPLIYQYTLLSFKKKSNNAICLDCIYSTWMLLTTLLHIYRDYKSLARANRNYLCNMSIRNSWYNYRIAYRIFLFKLLNRKSEYF